MTQKQEMVTDQLVHVIQTIQLGRGTGMLRVRRGREGTVEEGTITFVNGQVTDALVGRRKGSEAFNVLSTWSKCFFIFSPAGPQQRTIFFTTPPAHLQNGLAASSPQIQHAPPSVPVSPLRKRTTSPPSPATTTTSSDSLSPTNSVPFSAVPHLIKPIQAALRIIDTANLSRAHRQVLLLVNGQRTASEIARLTGRHEEEILRILQDLERVAIIQIDYRLLQQEKYY
ncbi:MAG: DUF4388 domain-containing protein [Ktedonobacteraceae bacterium]|nr:DUF4388 domain-containing protein [Ktedonobacteraceae bacterium]